MTKRPIFCPACGRCVFEVESVSGAEQKCKKCGAALRIDVTPAGAIDVSAVPRPTRENAGRLAGAPA